MAYFIGSLIGFIINGVVWGIITQLIISHKNYDENWFWWGFFFGFIAVIVAAVKPVNRSYYETKILSSVAMEKHDNDILKNSGWKCKKCGRVNPSYTGTCACGNTKANNVAAVSSKPAAPQPAKEPDQFQAIRKYKELLDDGIIGQEEFDKKKNELLNL